MRWLGILGLVLLGVANAGAKERASCGVCHSDVRVRYESGVHMGEVTCVQCHGGNPGAFSLAAHASSHGFKREFSRRGVVELCSSCHSDPVKMRPYNLRTDQYAQYMKSKHGERLTDGDERVAICTDCHSTHAILAASEPRSTTYPPAVPGICGSCHADEGLMAGYGLRADQLSKFNASVHAAALYGGDGSKAPSCATCHGTHGATPPQVADVSRVCGQCHIRERSYFNQSPHKVAMDRQRFSECAECHGEHLVTEPTLSLLEVACRKCHDDGSSELLEGEKIKTLLARAAESLDKADKLVRRATAAGVDVSIHRSRLLLARASLREAMVVQHTIDADRVQELTRSARSVGEDVQGAVHAAMAEDEVRTIGLVVAWFFLLCTAAVGYSYKKEIARAYGRQ